MSKKSKLTIGEFLNEIKLSEFDRHAKAIAYAYADCLVGEKVDMPKNSRDLNFFSKEALSVTELRIIVEHIIGSYNGFDLAAVERVIDVFGGDAFYFIGRESSPVIYVRPASTGRTWLGSGEDKISTLADEVSFEHVFQMFRFWWD